MGRFSIVNPNNFDYQYNGGMFGNTNYNMSVPPEELCIIVELVTTQKARSVLINNTQNGTISTKNSDGNRFVSFINGKKDGTTGYGNFLTTSYTDLGTENIIEEALGITNIQVEFNSSYAPMVNIDFVDVRGGAIFQSGAKSIYNVLFRLPYPLFELKIKGFYGKPVVYCLHMVKCNTRFNSQTGNFEISANFVGYTYAMFSDMILGYLRAAVRTKRGEELLASKGTISINEFMKKMNNIDELVKKQLENTSNVNRNNVALVNELQADLNAIESLVDSYIADLKDPTICETILGDTTEPYQNSIVFFPDPNSADPNSFTNSKASKISSKFKKEYKAKRDAYNTKVGNLLSAKLIVTDIVPGAALSKSNELIGPTGGPNNADLVDSIKLNYGDLIDVNNNDVINNVIKRLQNAAPKTLSPSDAYIEVFDVTETRGFIQNARTELTKSQKNFTDALAIDIANAIESELTFEPNIRNIFKMFTAHIEIFLQLVFEVSSKYLDDARINELKKFRSKDLTNQRLDIKKTDDAVIYPWPEYIENDEEKYLGSAGVLEIPLNVPEVKFVEELYTAMVQNNREDKEVQANANGVVAWQAFNPIDSINSIPDKTPYDRLPDSATHNDVARLIVLRAVGVLGWQPSNLIDDKEIESFATSEAELIIKKYETNKIILPALTSNYENVDKYSAVKGTVDGTEKNLLSASTYNNIDHWDYKYIEIPFKGGTPFNRYEIPADKGFTDITKPYYGNYSDFKLSNRSGNVKYDDNAETADTAKYISIIGSSDYDNANSQSPIAKGLSIFKYDNLTNEMNKPEDLINADFFLSNGKYGVQEYSLVDFSSKSEYGAGQLSYHSIFYDNPLIENGWEGIENGLSTPRINKETPLDLTFSGGAFAAYTFENITTSQYIDTFIPGERYNVLSNNHQSVGKNITLFSNETTQDQVAFPFFNFGAQTSKYSFNFSLFGSRLYNAQTSVYPKAFLFLHCFPWKGLVGKSSRSDGKTYVTVTHDIGIFKQKEIFNTFAIRNGFVKVPKLWPAFIGSLIWRYREGLAKNNPVKFKIGNESLIPGFSTDDDDYPKYDEYLKAYPDVYSYQTSKTQLNIFGLPVATGNDALNDNQSNFPMFFCDRLDMNYEKIDPEILALPPKVQDLFVSEFDTFVKGEFTNDIIPLLDITKGDGTAFFGDSQWKAQWDILRSSTVVKTDAKSLEEYNVNGSYTEITVNTLAKMNELYGNKLNIGKLEDNYSVMTYIYSPTNGKFDYNLFIEYKQNGPAEKKLKDLLFSYKYIENDSVFIWSNGITNTNPTPAFLKSKFSKYIDTINQALKTKVTEDQKTIVSPGENEKIKLEIYRTVKKIYDKWVAGVGGSPRPFSDILFQCCSRGTNQPYRLSGDTAINAKYGNGKPNELNLIDSFRFVTRSFQDISTQFQIHPVMVTHQMYESPDTSIYDLFGRILTDNNFEFIALPNFINFNDPKELHSVFEPYPYYMAQKQTATGPSFVCVYVGQTSTKLDFGPDSEYPNDGFDITNDKTWPKDFSEEKASWEDFASAFIVSYGQQNQNIFKDIRLDQSEFNETAESLSITDAISNSLSSTNQSYVGQNLYNVYSVRSYKAEVEMLGNAMIQPMMYFQLDNIPMFHGAYLITKVTHSIVPNNMTTVFTGTRIRIAKTPLIDKATLYSSLISGQEIGGATAGSTIKYTPTQLLAPIAATIFRNEGQNAYLNQTNNQITMKKVAAPNGVGNLKAGTQVDAPAPDNENELNESLITEAANALEKMLTDFVAYAKQNNYKTFSSGNYINITSLYRNATKQANLVKDNIKNKKPAGSVAAVGTSYHGWGLAVDLQTIDANGNALQISTDADNLKRGFDQNINISLKWFLENCWRYGFWMPLSLRDGSGVEEFWHFEYHGTTAICLWEKYPQVNNPNNIVKIPTNPQYDPVVKNPKEPDGKEAVYNGCDFVEVKGTANYDMLSSDLLWIYFSWQQGPDGAAQHYKVANGTQASYKSNVTVAFFTDNWPGNLVSDSGVKKSDISTLYSSNPQKLANAFLNVWTKQLPIKAAEAQTLINSSAKDDLGRPYLRLKDIFKKYEQPNEGFSLDNIITMGMQENALLTYTDPNNGYAGMFQMGKRYDIYKPYITRSFKGKSGYKNYDEYDADIMTEGFVKIGIENFKSFKKETGYNSQALNSSTQPTSTNSPTTLKNIIIGDSLVTCLESILITAGSSARRISPTQSEASLHFGGKDTTWLIGALKKYPVSTGVENVVVSIGTNDGFQNSNNLIKVLTELRRVFPNAKYLFVRGSGGWIGNIKYKPNGDIKKIYGTTLNGTTTYDNTDVISYYSVLNGQPNVTVLNQGVGYSASDGEAHNCTGPYKLHYPVLANEIKSKIG
jgi:LAS superfamily LD-carboxypeptidase LdcB